MRLIYHSKAEAELIEAAQFYEARVPQLGAQFLQATGVAGLSDVTPSLDRHPEALTFIRVYLCLFVVLFVQCVHRRSSTLPNSVSSNFASEKEAVR